MTSTFKITILGASSKGKTVFLSSLNELSFEAGRNGFHVQPENFIDSSDPTNIRKIWGEVTASTQKIRNAKFNLKNRAVTLQDITIIDIIGQAMQGNSVKKEDADAILQNVVDSSALILVIEAPKDLNTLQIAKLELAQQLNFSQELLKKKDKKVPIALVLTKIDAKPGGKEIGNKISEIDGNLIKQYGDNFSEFKRAILNERGQMISKIVRPLVTDVFMYQVIDQFYNFFDSSSMPMRAFPCSSLGFSHKIEGDRITNIQPYGTSAVLLWLIYAFYRTQQGVSSVGLPLEEILSDLTDVYKSGRAYFDDSEILWNLRNLGDIYLTPNL